MGTFVLRDTAYHISFRVSREGGSKVCDFHAQVSWRARLVSFGLDRHHETTGPGQRGFSYSSGRPVGKELAMTAVALVACMQEEWEEEVEMVEKMPSGFSSIDRVRRWERTSRSPTSCVNCGQLQQPFRAHRRQGTRTALLYYMT